MNVRKTGQGFIVDGRPMSPERFAYLYPDYIDPEQAAAADTATGEPAAAAAPLTGFRAMVAKYREEQATAPKTGPIAGDILTSEGPKRVDPIAVEVFGTPTVGDALLEALVPVSDAEIASEAVAVAPAPVAAVAAPTAAAKVKAAKAMMKAAKGIKDPEKRAIAELQAEVALVDATPVVSTITAEMIAKADALVAQKDAEAAAKAGAGAE